METMADVLQLCVSGAAPHDRSKGQFADSPLFVAASAGVAAAVEPLVAAGADVDERSADMGWTPLMVAACHGHVATVAALLRAGADPRVEDPVRRTVLSAALDGCPDVVRLVLEAAAPVGPHEFQGALQDAIRQNQIDIVRLMLQAGVQPTYSALCTAASWGHAAAARALLEAGAPVSSSHGFYGERDETPLLLAVQGGHLPVVELLLDVGAAKLNPAPPSWLGRWVWREDDVQPPLVEALRYDTWRCARVLLRRGADVAAARRYCDAHEPDEAGTMRYQLRRCERVKSRWLAVMVAQRVLPGPRNVPRVVAGFL